MYTVGLQSAANAPFHLPAHAASKLLPPPHLTAAALVPNLLPVPHLQEPTPDKIDSLEKPSISDGVDWQCVLPDMTLGLEDHQYFSESRLRKSVLTFIHHPRTIIMQFLAGRSRDFKRAS